MCVCTQAGVEVLWICSNEEQDPLVWSTDSHLPGSVTLEWEVLREGQVLLAECFDETAH